MSTIELAVAIIGAGTAGMTACGGALEHPDRVIVIESAVYDTTRAQVGCMPSKLLIAAAGVSHQIDIAGVFGISVMNKAIIEARLASDSSDRFCSGAA